MKRNLVLVIGLLLIAFGIIRYTNGFLSYKAPYGIIQFEALHEQAPDTIDVLFVGTSHVYSDINPAVIWKQNGIASFDLATGGSHLKNSYYVIEDALRTQSPELIVLELLGVLGNHLSDREVMDSHWGLGSIVSQWKSLQLNAEKEDMINFLLRFPFYHNRYSNVIKNDFDPYTHNYSYGDQKFYLYPKKRKDIYKGAVTLSYVTPFEQLPDLTGIEERASLDEENQLYLGKIINLAEKENIKLLFIVSPYAGCTAEHQMKYNYVSEIAKEKGIDYVNFNLMYSELELDRLTDFAEGSHLNFRGMWKYSRWLGDYISERYMLPDRSQESGYATWDEYFRWEEQVFHNYSLTQEADVNKYLEMLNSPDYVVAISCDKVSPEAMQTLDFKYIDSEYLCGNVNIWEPGKGITTLVDNELFCKDVGSSQIIIKKEGESRKVFVDGKSCKKVEAGINLIVYDTYVDVLADSVGFSYENGWKMVR